MNLSDIRKEGEEFKEVLPQTVKIMNILIEIVKSKEKMKVELYKKSFELHNIPEQFRSYVSGIISFKDNYCNEFINSLRKIRFTKSIIELTKISKEFNYYDFDTFRKEYIDLIDKIAGYTESQVNVNEFEKIEEVYNDVKKVTDLYEKILINIKKTSELDSLLSQGIETCQFNIRFMNENKTIASLKENIILIEKIYNSINKLVGDPEEDLTYYRAESGSFMLWLAGCTTTLLTMKPLLEFAYRIYSEQLSPKAKIELELKKEELKLSKIKVRGEYLKLLKDVTESKEISSLKIQDKTEVLTIIGNLDEDIKDLFCKNPFIKLDDRELGLKENSNENIPIVLLDEKDEKIESLKQLEEIACDNTCDNGNNILEE